MDKFLNPVNLTRIRTIPLCEIDLLDPFFDSLREDYLEFDKWFVRVASQGRLAWVVDSSEFSLAALCIFKIESEGEHITDDGKTLRGEFLKICTLKVQEFGIKYGARLLAAAFNYAENNRLTAIYVQVRENRHQRLKDLLVKYGFRAVGRYKNDMTFVKPMLPGPVPHDWMKPCVCLEYDIMFYPHYLDGSHINKFIISLSDYVHARLFPDAQTQTFAFPTEDNPVIGEANAICKTILQNDTMTSIRPGDLLFFYSRGIDRYIDCMGFVEDYHICPRGSRCPDRYVSSLPFSATEVASMLSKREMMLIGFRLIQYLCEPINRKVFSRAGFDIKHRSIQTLPEQMYTEIIVPRLKNYAVRVNKGSSKFG